ncbi:SPOR domain-containing protein [Massilia sp. PAMC28688]|uniref:SPOR domain-containing protein n=1 Tax=Massilia sp. PAMC28688 TaxID=2861283 RepID=UPI001C630608|nr:SPOR domain-containing protein [Massilia sp. PAMC28688]QYF92198.1 SPOR domain-containing protein [Massilia sp. PAMC28688]
MGLFSFLNKNKQETAGDEGEYVSRDDDALAAKARSKRASSANEPAARRGKEGRAAADPVLPEKKRARRRLVGAIALALAVAIGLPMVLDSEPRPLATDIDIRIPSKEKAPPQQLPAPESAAAPVPAAEALDTSEEIVDPAASGGTPSRAKPETRPDTRPGPKPDIMPEPRIVEKPPAKVAEARPAEPKPEVKPAARTDSERALAILENKPVPAPAAANQKYTIQVVALSNQDKVAELQAKLKAAGVPSFTQKGSGDLVRVKVGPFTKDESDEIRAKLGKLGLSGAMVAN